MSGRPVEPIPLWRHDQRAAMVCGAAALLLLLLGLSLLLASFDQRLKTELDLQALQAGRTAPSNPLDLEALRARAARAPAPSSSSLTTT